MIFAKVDVTLPQHHRVLDVRSDMIAEAVGVWVIALCYTRQQQLDGYCPLTAIRHVARDEVLAELVRVGLLSREEKDGRVAGYVVCKYAEHNETRSQIARRLKADRVRKSSGRKPSKTPSGVPSEEPPESDPDSERKGAGIPDSDSPSVSLSVSSQGERERESGTIRVARTSTDDGAFGGSVDAWTEGVRTVAPGFPRPAGTVATALVNAFLAQRWGPTEILERARAAGAAYAQARRGKTLKPHDYCDWEGSGRPAGMAKAPVQGVPSTGRLWKVGKS